MGNDNDDRSPESQQPHMDEPTLTIIPTFELVTIEEVQAMIQVMFAKHMEKIRQQIWEDRKDPTTPVIESVLKEGQSK